MRRVENNVSGEEQSREERSGEEQSGEEWSGVGRSGAEWGGVERSGAEQKRNVTGIKVVFRKREYGDPDVRKDEIFRHKVEEPEELLRRRPRLGRHVVVGVVGLADAAKQDGDDAGQAENLGYQEPEENRV